MQIANVLDQVKSKINLKSIPIAIILTLAVSGVMAVVWIINVIQYINAPQMEYAESYVLYISQLFGSNQYPWDINQYPYMTTFYTPLLYVVLGQLGEWFGYSLLLGRVIILLSTFGCLIMVYLIVHQITNN